MSDLARKPKDAKDWNEDDLKAYNITVKEQGFQEFFGLPTMPHLETVDRLAFAERITYKDYKNFSSETFSFVMHALCDNFGEANNLDWATALLSFAGYLRPHRYLCRNGENPWKICNDNRTYDYGLGLLSFERMIMTVRWAPSFEEGIAKVVAMAIGMRSADFDWEKKKIIPALLIVDRVPIFVKVPTALDLNLGVLDGTYPTTPTVVHVFKPPTAGRGMWEGQIRFIVLQAMEAFKQFVND
ncbi:hypothetical protein HYPSUDRAFT_55105 [Hypholoma sublateritium FD-334 SS-4]|uniref:Fungal-type protein kinase domain-containing protein n=1 Tax=Hypholoma sublateritium (strain FD-334 SS-4) TaxID=945553 RepID=A0A0D2PPY9_HYPSF|nr:hypothetical protein HYPSUDRAFT_55105 [Hypholoma sublateritium FD-334 SS-4]